MKTTRIVIVIGMLMHVVFFIALNNVLNHGGDQEIMMFFAMWSGGALISLFKLYKAIRAERILTLFDKIGCALFGLVSFLPLILGAWLVMLFVSFSGADFR